MKQIIFLFALLIAANVHAQPNSDVITIVNVNLIDVDKQKLIPNATVQFANGKIQSIITGKKNITGARIIDGTGKYLMPGMTDAHIHFFQSGGLYTRPDAIDLKKFVPYEKEIEQGKSGMADVMKWTMLNGITSVIDVGATYNLLSERKKYADSNFAPVVYMTGPLLTTYEPAAFKGLGNDRPFSLIQTEEEARKMVQEQLAYKPDFIKIWYIVLGKNKEEVARKHLPIIKAVIDEAHKNNLKVAVHATERITAQLSVENGADFLVHGVEDEVINNDFVKLLKEKKTVLCPTMVVAGNYNKVFGQENHFHKSEFERADPFVLGSLFDLQHLNDGKIKRYKDGTRSGKQADKTTDSICIVNLKKLSDGGVRIAAGTDAGNIGTLHGGSYVTELLKMKEAGMSNWQVIQSATINPSYILSKEKETGSIAKGKTADLLLLEANPLDDLNNLSKISMIVNRGNIIDAGSLVKETALALVQRQLNAYNARDLEAFMEPYADDVELYDYNNGKLLGKGKEQMKKDYAFFKQVPELHCEIKARIVQGNIIIDKESVTGFGGAAMQATAIYHIKDNKISKVYFIQ
ncbi:MAG: amidohydrolase family protein [Rhizobacter sp.]|nr:amidohydrolase family protein [Ferruginibacter sp.]